MWLIFSYGKSPGLSVEACIIRHLVAAYLPGRCPQYCVSGILMRQESAGNQRTGESGDSIL